MRPGGESVTRLVSSRGHRSRLSLRKAFTLIEMVVVIGIVLIVMGIALPSVNTMWAQHRENDANNGISGMLMSTRAKAIQADRGEVGMFFYLDSKGVQQIALITRDPEDIKDDKPSWATEPVMQNVFTVAQDGGRGLLSPMRAVPRSVVDPVASAEQSHSVYSTIEIGNEDFDNLAALEIDNAQRHRNYFVVLFSPEGRLIPARNVLIRDRDKEEGGEGDGFGDITGLLVSDEVDEFFIGGEKRAFADLGDKSLQELLGAKGVNLIVPREAQGVALGFPSVDGVMVYDDSALQTGGDAADKRQVLLETAHPYYIHRLNGSVIRGPVGEVPPEEGATP